MWSGSLVTSPTMSRTAKSAWPRRASTPRPRGFATSRSSVEGRVRALTLAALALGLAVGTARAELPLRIDGNDRLSPAQERQLKLDRWYRHERDGFTLYSNGRPDAIVRAGTELLRYRSAVLQLLGVAESELAPHPLHIYLLTPRSAQALLGKRSGVLGFMAPGLAQHQIVATLLDRGAILGARNRVVFHEYVHHLLRSGSAYRYPPWYEEGVAELLSTAQPTRRGLRFGAAPAGALQLLSGPAPSLRALVSYRPAPDTLDISKDPAFYARAWKLAHFLLFATDEEAPARRNSLGQYLEAYAAGQPGGRAFKAAFGRSLKDLNTALVRYQTTGHSFELPQQERSAPDHQPVALTLREARAALAALLKDQAPETVLDWFPADKTDRPLAAVTANALISLARWQQAEDYLERARARRNDDYRLPLIAAQLHLMRCRAEDPGGRCSKPEVLARVVNDTAAAHELAPEHAETRVRHAQALLREGRAAEARTLLLAARKQVPASYEALRDLGIAYLNLGRWQRASRLLSQAAAWAIDVPSEHARILKLLKLVRQGEAAERTPGGRDMNNLQD